MTARGPNPSRRIALRRLAALVSIGIGGCDRPSGLLRDAGRAATTPPHPGATFSRVAFPLRRNPGKRYLVDADGRPFLLVGDSGWSLLVQVTREDAQTYLDDRRVRGYNAILVNLLERKYSSDSPRNRYGEAPFIVEGDYTKPNDRYFDHAAWVLHRAAEVGQVVLLAATYIGCCGADGWYAAMTRSGPAALREYGRYLARKFADLRNIVWVHGGDGNPDNPTLVAEVATGIREVDTWSLHTAHTGPGHEAMAIYPDADWLDLNNIYTYDPVLPIALRAYHRRGPEPYFLIESEYEGENRRAPDIRIRAQAWQAMLGGAMGQVVGNNPIWHFASPKPITPFTLTWQQSLASEASRSMTQLRRLFESFDWWRLEPEEGSLIKAGRCDGHYGAVGACTPQGDRALVYVPWRRQFALDLRRLGTEPTSMRWYDPVDGSFSAPVPLPWPGHAPLRLLPPPQPNAGGDSDRVLVIERIAAGATS